MHEGEQIGGKRQLVFYRGKNPKGVKTQWNMNEFTLTTSTQRREQNGGDDMRVRGKKNLLFNFFLSLKMLLSTLMIYNGVLLLYIMIRNFFGK